MKSKSLYFIIAFSVILIGTLLLVSSPRNAPEWQRQSSIIGSYTTDYISSRILNFSSEDNSFWILDVNDEGDKEVFYSGYYTSFGDNLFVFEGSEIGELESFSIINRHLDIEIIISGESYIFRRISDATFGIETN
jgi:hypothetical protein